MSSIEVEDLTTATAPPDAWIAHARTLVDAGHPIAMEPRTLAMLLDELDRARAAEVTRAELHALVVMLGELGPLLGASGPMPAFWRQLREKLARLVAARGGPG